MSRLYSLAQEKPDVTYDDFTYERILQARITYANAPVTINNDALDLSARLAAITVALETLDQKKKEEKVLASENLFAHPTQATVGKMKETYQWCKFPSLF